MYGGGFRSQSFRVRLESSRFEEYRSQIDNVFLATYYKADDKTLGYR